MTGGLLIPAILLGLLGWLVPKLWSMILPEGIPGLFVIAILSALTLTAVTGGYFLFAYWMEGVTLSRLIAGGRLAALVHFGQLGLSAAIIWGPMMGLSLMGLPRTWTKVTW